jgi:hypothetical protein
VFGSNANATLREDCVDSYVNITARWNTRPESPEEIAERLARWLSRLVEIDPLLGTWARGGMRHRSIVPRLVTMPPNRSELRDWVAENPSFEAKEGRKQTIGHSIEAWSPHDALPSNHFWITASSETSPSWLGNKMGITWYPPRDDVQELSGVVSAVVLATGTAWDCEWAGASPGDFGERQPDSPLPKFQSGWMVYLGHALAARLTKPEGIAIEHLPNGAVLLTTVSNAIFDHHNTEHWSAARRLHVALNQLGSTGAVKFE